VSHTGRHFILFASRGYSLMDLSPAHQQAVNRRRRIVVQYDAHGQMGAPFAEWLDFRFAYLDEPGSQIDSVWWDIGAGSWAVYPSQVLPRLEHAGLGQWWEQGIDWVAELIGRTRRSGREVFWNHRVSEVDISPTGDLEPGWRLMLESRNPIKEAHPDWVLKTWWWQGMWNFAHPDLRQWQLDVLTELVDLYDLDGLQLDFARHIPCLPVGHQWELRDHLTEFVRRVREMLLAVAERRGRPFLLAARVPQTLAGCRADGFDIAAWAEENLVDILTLGSRTMTVAVEDFAQVVAGHNIKLQPCFDDHHTTDGYRYQPIEFLRGVFANWWQQGADGVYTFNWSNASPEQCEEFIARRWGLSMMNEPGPISHQQAYHEVGSPETMVRKDKVFAAERRGGYPWAEGYFNRNDDAPLPLALRHDGTPLPLSIRLSDPVAGDAEQVQTLLLRAVLFEARAGDELDASFNGVPVTRVAQDFAWQDPQIFSPQPQPPSGGNGQYVVNPDQQLLRLDFAIPPELCRVGLNEAAVTVRDRLPYCSTEIVLEKLEVHVGYF
jgi:hypothetical protein